MMTHRKHRQTATRHDPPRENAKLDHRYGKIGIPAVSVVGLTIDQLKGAPTYAANELPTWGDRAYETRIHDCYKMAPYWGV